MLNVLCMLRNNSNPLLKKKGGAGGVLHPIVLEHSIAPRFSCAPLEALVAASCGGLLSGPETVLSCARQYMLRQEKAADATVLQECLIYP